MFAPDRYVAALRFAAERHNAQKFPGTELPYLLHVTSVAAEVIAAVAVEPVERAELAVICALLHDTIEDTATTYAEIADRFGAAVADGVQALSKDPALPKSAQMADSLARIKAQPREIAIVKLADRSANLGSPPTRWTAEKRRSYRDEAIVLADTLAGAHATLEARIRSRIEGYLQYL